MVSLSLDAGPRGGASVCAAAPASAAGENQLLARIRRALISTGHPGLRHVRVAISGGRVRLHGVVPSWFLKQIAQSAVLNVSGVDAIENQLVVG